MDNGVPAKEVEEWRDIWSPKTGSHWRTKKDELTGETLSYDPFTSYIWRNPANDFAAEAVLREELLSGNSTAQSEGAGSLLSTFPKEGPTPEALEGPIQIWSPSSGFSTADRIVEVNGTADDFASSSIRLATNGRESYASINKGRFSGVVSLTVGPNEIVAGTGVNASKPVTVNCTDDPSQLWIKLVWDGSGDVDLHVTQPNGADVAYNNTNPPGGGRLDVDNTHGFGPEHESGTRSRI